MEKRRIVLLGATGYTGQRVLRELVGAENPVTLCDLGILADQAAEPVPPYKPDVCA